jgi:hypothetical protein
MNDVVLNVTCALKKCFSTFTAFKRFHSSVSLLVPCKDFPRSMHSYHSSPVG